VTVSILRTLFHVVGRLVSHLVADHIM